MKHLPFVVLLLSAAAPATPGGVTRSIYGLDPESGKASGEMVIDMTSGASGSGSRDRRMHREIIESGRYPEAIFTPDHVDGHVALQGESQIDLHGMFGIHGADHDLTLHFTVQASDGQFTASTHFI